MKNLLVYSLLFTSLAAFGSINPKSTVYDSNHMTITSVEVFDITEQTDANILENGPSITDTLNKKINDLALDATPIGGALNQIDLIVDKVINIGQKIWTVVEKGRPSASYTGAKATALPANTLNWTQLENWKMPRTKTISVVYKNVYGLEVVRFTYRIILLYGGSANGVGRYIGYAAVEPVEMTTAYMYTFNATASVDTVFNMGNSTDPLGAMLLKINWTVETVLKKTTMTHTYTLDGAGNINSDQNKVISRLL